MSWLAVDIGGANLKAANGCGYAATRPFALWREPEQLEGELRAIIAAAPACDRIAATMTGELADCFASKADGVNRIVNSLVAAAGVRHVAIYATDGSFRTPDDAKRDSLAVAASNWHALAAFVARFARSRPALLVDVGSTTADIIPLDASGPAATGRTDPQRLLAGELVYTGVERTPIAAIVSHLPWLGESCPVASELFATSVDAYLMLDELPEDPTNVDTADGRPRTLAAAHARLARMVCADATMFSESEAVVAAKTIRDAQVGAIAAAVRQVIDRMPTPPEVVILSGHGEFLARAAIARVPWRLVAPEALSLNSLLGPHVSRCAPAHALAVLAQEK
jgi:probable H4MPT-linked C1 transfer pathway protein